MLLSAFGLESLNKGIEGFALSGAAGAGAQPNSTQTQNPAVNSRSNSNAPVSPLDPALVDKLKTLQEELSKASTTKKKSSIALALSDEYIRLKRYDLAGKYSEIALQAQSKPSLDLSIRTANLYDDAEQDSLAAIFYQKSLDIDPLKTDVRVDFAICLLSIGDFDGGKREMERAVRDNPSHQKANLNVGIIYLQTNEITKARGFWEKALKINPSNDAGSRAKELLDTYR
ncbi:MAG: hypothetical protein SFU91_10120 [Chloroherpetonaceae bacterium]|nr:hypothetical protein [Chloroherpetonaceae bacterium]